MPPDDEQSNYRLAREHLLEPLGIAPERVHRMRGELAPDEAAAAYERELRAALGDESFDLVLLGLGADGHTASLFPGSPALHERERLVLATEAPGPPRERVTLTPGALERSRFTLFLVAGEGKARALAESLGPEPPVVRHVLPRGGACVWLVDAAAARLTEAGR